VHVSVNLSPLQFRDEELINEVDAALAESGLPPTRLELEITETTVLETNNQTIEALLDLHGRGIRIALDDFGTGYSSLSYLRRFPFNKIKIDRSFIRDLGQEKDDASIILAIIGLAKSMKMVVTAEGVETERQAAFLNANGCTQAQGFLFYRPLSAEAVFEAIAENQSSTNAAAPNVIRSAAE
jgi:EAL domain-containing protein (putative c-di-GMP-specific phosphodiesterase class I)